MSITRDGLIALFGALFPNNSAQEIDAADLRQGLTSMLNQLQLKEVEGYNFAHSEDVQYKANDVVLYNGGLYKANKTSIGSFDITNFDRVLAPARGIESMYISGMDLYVVYDDSSTDVNLGHVVGADGIDGVGITGTSYNTSSGKVTFSFSDGTTFLTGDLRGRGIASSSYNSSTGVLTLTYTDSTTFSTGDLRGTNGTNGRGIASQSYNSGTGVLTFTFTDSTTYSTGDLRGRGIASSSYNSSTGVLTLTYTDSTTFSTGDLRGGSTSFNPSSMINTPYGWDDFDEGGGISSTSIASKYGVAILSGTSTSIGNPGVTNSYGVIAGARFLQTGTTSTGSACIGPAGSGFNGGLTIGAGKIELKTRILIPVLPTSTDDFIVRFGVGTVNNGAGITLATGTQVYGWAFVEAVRSGSNTIWRINTGSFATGVTLQATSSGSTNLVANTWYRLRLVIDSANNLVELYVDSATTPAISHTSNIIAVRPSSTYYGACALGIGIQKLAGTTNCILVADYMGHEYTGTSRS